MAEGGELHVTWPCNPVGAGSRGHKPAPNKRARRSPTPPTPLHPSDALAFPTVPPTSAAATPAMPQASHPTGKGSSALAAAPSSAHPAAATTNAQMAAQLPQPAQPPLGITQQQQQSLHATHQPQVSLALPQVPQPCVNQACTSAEAKSAASANSKMPHPDSAFHQSPPAMPMSSARPHQSLSAAPAPAATGTPALVTASYVPAMQSSAAVSQPRAELNAVAATADAVMSVAPLLSSAAVQDPQATVATGTQRKHEADQAEAMVVDDSDGKQETVAACRACHVAVLSCLRLKKQIQCVL